MDRHLIALSQTVENALRLYITDHPGVGHFSASTPFDVDKVAFLANSCSQYLEPSASAQSTSLYALVVHRTRYSSDEFRTVHAITDLDAVLKPMMSEMYPHLPHATILCQASKKAFMPATILSGLFFWENSLLIHILDDLLLKGRTESLYALLGSLLLQAQHQSYKCCSILLFPDAGRR